MGTRLLNKNSVRLVLILLLVQAYIISFSQRTSFTVFDKSNGLDCNYVNEIVSDNDGYFWIGTDRGVVRFDGINFLWVPSREGKQGFVRRLRIFGNNLFVIYEDLAGIDLIDVRDFSFRPFAGPGFVDVAQQDDSTTFLFERTGRLVRRRGGKIIQEIRTPGNEDGILQIWNNKLFFHPFTSDLYCYDPENLSLIRKFEVPAGEINITKLRVSDGKLIYDTSSKSRAIDSLLVLQPLRGLSDDVFRGRHFLVFVSDDLQYYIKSYKQLISVKNGVRSKMFLPLENRQELRALYAIDSLNLLLGLNGSLIHFRAGKQAISSFDVDPEVAPGSVRVRRNILPASSDLMFLCGYPGIVRRKDGVMTQKKITAMSFYFSDAVLFGNKIYATAENRTIYFYDTATAEIRQIAFRQSPPAEFLSSLAPDRSTNSIIVGGDGILHRYDPSSNTLSRLAEMSKGRISVIRKSEEGEWWVGNAAGLFRFDSHFNRKRIFTDLRKDDPFAGQNINDIYQAGPNLFWIAHDYGAQLLDLKRNQIIDSLPASFLPDHRVACILQDTLGRVWASTFNGIMGFDPGTRTHLVLGEKAGLINKEFNRRSSAVLADGKFIFGGDGGYDVVDPYAFDFSSLSSLGRITVVEWFTEEGHRNKIEIPGNGSDLEFNTDTESVRISVSTNDPVQAGSSRFEYRFNQGVWKSLTSGGYLDIYKLSPDLYDLEFRGFDRFGNKIFFKPVRLRAVVAFYKSKVFIVSVLTALVISLIAILWIIRRNQNREKQLRESISMDLHDEVGTILTRALMVTETIDFPQQNKTVQGYLSDALFRLRTYIRTMSREDITTDGFLVDLREMVQTVTRYSGVRIRFEGDGGTAGVFTGSTARDIKLSLFELLNNALKHSGCTEIRIDFGCQNGFCKIAFMDNGTLISLDQLKKTGNGLINLQRRVQRHGGSLKFHVSPGGNGLSVELYFKY